MKKCFKWLINWFKRWVNNMSVPERIAFAIGGIIGIISGIIIYLTMDIVPATANDYKPLQEKVLL